MSADFARGVVAIVHYPGGQTHQETLLADPKEGEPLRAVHASVEPPELAFYCPECAGREFGED